MDYRNLKKSLKIIARFGILFFILFFVTSIFFVAPAKAEVYCDDGLIVNTQEECTDSDSGSSGDTTKTIEYDNPLETDNIIDVVERVADYFYYIAIALVPIFVIYASVLFLTAAGNEQQVAKARKTFIWLAIGVAVLLIGSGFITLIKDILNVE